MKKLLVILMIVFLPLSYLLAEKDSLRDLLEYTEYKGSIISHDTEFILSSDYISQFFDYILYTPDSLLAEHLDIYARLSRMTDYDISSMMSILVYDDDILKSNAIINIIRFDTSDSYIKYTLDSSVEFKEKEKKPTYSVRYSDRYTRLIGDDVYDVISYGNDDEFYLEYRDYDLRIIYLVYGNNLTPSLINNIETVIYGVKVNPQRI